MFSIEAMVFRARSLNIPYSEHFACNQKMSIVYNYQIVLIRPSTDCTNIYNNGVYNPHSFDNF